VPQCTQPKKQKQSGSGDACWIPSIWLGREPVGRTKKPAPIRSRKRSAATTNRVDLKPAGTVIIDPVQEAPALLDSGMGGLSIAFDLHQSFQC